jgi:hypothetical protein
MKATTIKLEKPLLDQIYELMPKGKSLSKFVKEVLQKEVNRSKMVQAASEYNSFLAENLEEASLESDWEKADLSTDPIEVKK